MRRFITVVFLIYLVLLSASLLTSNPFAVAGAKQSWLRANYQAYVEPVSHLLSFAALGILGAGSRWPRRFSFRIVLLVIYAFGTELLQYLVPERTPESKDLVQDLCGIAIGAAIWRAIYHYRRKPFTETPVHTTSAATPRPPAVD